MQLMSGIRALKYFPEPGTLRPRVAGEVENDRNTLRQDGADVRRQSIPQAGRAIETIGDVGDLPAKEALQELRLNEQDGLAALGETLASVDLPAAILPHKNISFAG